MTGANRDILKFVRQARDRMHMELMLDYTVKALNVSMGIYLALAVLSRFVPVYNAYIRGALLAGGLTLTGFLISIFMTPKDKTAAMLLDSKGLNERTLTALELMNDESAIAMLQSQDALKYLKALDIKKEVNIKYPTRLLLIACLLGILIMVSGFIPNPMEERAIELHNIKNEVTRQQKEIDNIIKKVENNERLSIEQKKDAEAALQEVRKELGKAQDLKEAEKALQRAENKLGLLKQEYSDKDLNNIIDAFSKNEVTKSLAEALKKGDAAKLKSDFKNTAEALKNLSVEQLKELSQNLSELAKTLGQNPELAGAFSQLAQKMAAGELGDLENEMNELGDQISELMGNDDFSAAMEEVMLQLRNSSSQNQGQGQSGGQGQNQGQVQNQGQGQGQGQSGGSPAGGAGTGTGGDSEVQSPQGSGTGIGNKQPSSSDVREYEKVFTPSLAGGEAEKSQLQGGKTDEGETKQYIVDNGLGIKGDMRPYNQIIGEYKEKAFQSIEGRQIPQGMQDIVKDYFSSLED